MKVPLVDLRASFLPIREEVLRQFDAILSRMDLFLGPNVQSFEREFAAYCEVDHGIGVSSGTDALFAALTACGIGPGDEVIVPAHTFIATIESVVHTGATPVMVDVEPETLTIDVGEIRSAMTPSTRAIVPVHLYGHPADMDPILGIARDHGLRVIEDAAQAHGARYKGRRCGSMGDAGCFSFYFTKNLGAIGEGGFVTARDEDLAQTVRLLRDHGHSSKHEHQILGYNLRMDELQAAVLRIKLRGLEACNERRRELARRYDSFFEGSEVQTLGSRTDCDSVHHLYPVRVDDRDALMAYLEENGVGTGIHYRIPAHLQPALSRHPHRSRELKTTEQACQELLSLPIYPELTDAQLGYVAEHVLHFVNGRGRASARAGLA